MPTCPAVSCLLKFTSKIGNQISKMGKYCDHAVRKAAQKRGKKCSVLSMISFTLCEVPTVLKNNFIKVGKK